MPDSGITTNITPHTSASAPLPHRNTMPMTNIEMLHPTSSNTAAIGTRPNPSVDTSNEKNTNAPATMTPIPIASFNIPNSATPATYSHSRIGVTIRLSKLRDHVSSRNPVLTAI